MLGIFETDNVFLVVILFIVGIALIVKGGDFFVDAASWIAIKSGIPKFIIGATIVSLATTLPELIVSVIGAVDGYALLSAGNESDALGKVALSVGNAIGSVTANTGLIMGISLCFIPAVIDRKKYLLKSLLLIVSVALILILSLDKALTIIDSILLLILVIVFIVENVISAKNSIEEVATESSSVCESSSVSEEPSVSEAEEPVEEEKPQSVKRDVVINILKFVFGVIGIVLGAQLLIDEGTVIAHKLGVPEAIIGLTMVAIGTSLPELVTTITAIVKKQSALSVGNIIGANIIDICLILPICSFVYQGSFPIENRTIYLDMPICFTLIAIALIPTLIRGKFSRVQGFILIGLYITYAVVISVFPNLI